MPRAKWHLDKTVVDAARERVEHIYDMFDHVAVMYSGGKDSEACMLLVKEYHEKNNLGPVNVIFKHEEVINPSVVEFMKLQRERDWINMNWFCLPLVKTKFVLSQREAHTEWDPHRDWIGEQPDWAITYKELGMDVEDTCDDHTADDMLANYLFPSGKVAFITGVRASESLTRFRAVTQKLNENYISSIEHNTKSRVKLCKPIYDWEQNDVLKYIMDCGEDWCPVYEAQDLVNVGLRVSTALHPTAAKKIDKLAEIEPEFYQRIVDVFPEMQDQARYWKDFDPNAIIAPYKDQGFNGAMRFIYDNMAPETQQDAIKNVRLWKSRYEKDPVNYPIDLLLKNLALKGASDQRMAGLYVDAKGYKE